LAGFPLRRGCDIGGGCGALEQSGFRSEDIDWFVAHQANKRIIDGIARQARYFPGAHARSYGNTSAASIPLAMSDAGADRRIKRGDLVMSEARNSGLSWGLPSSGGSGVGELLPACPR